MEKLILGLHSEGVSSKIFDDCILFFQPNTNIKSKFKRTYDNQYSLEELVKTSQKLVNPDLESSLKTLVTQLKKIFEGESENENENSINFLPESNLTNLPNILDLPRDVETDTKITENQENQENQDSPDLQSESYLGKRRTRMSSFTTSPVSVSINKQLFLLIHNAAADLSILSDFEKYKEGLDLVNKCFVTLGTPLKVCGLDVKIRDTQLLAPGGSRSLLAVSKLYEGIPKLKLSKSDITDMEGLWNRDPKLFTEYAMQDALITLVHGCRMASFNLELGGFGVPVTLSSLAGRYLKNS